ncbi:UNVERIFIED_CONTAM: Hemicentin-1 [Trichonephila clavipes]
MCCFCQVVSSSPGVTENTSLNPCMGKGRLPLIYMILQNTLGRRTKLIIRYWPGGYNDDAPIISISFGASQQNELIREGSDVYLDCNILANPLATDIRWRFHTKPLFHDPSKGIIMRNNTLILQNVQRSHRGRYRCLASNLEGESVSDEALLRVQCKYL